eukprot:m.151229 g.151229  ORF g.151229 m.151229 type:complete len:282 (-) comp10152_c0_seq5:2145-2990(-)
MLRTKKATTRKGKRVLESRQPQVVESAKKFLIMRGEKCSEPVRDFLKDLAALTKPNSTLFSRKHPLRPFDDEVAVLKHTSKLDASLFAVATHSKKRPHNLIFGRLFDGQMYDMVEFGVEAFKPLGSFKGEKNMMGSKPCITFQGDLFETDANFRCARSLLSDVFRGTVATSINLAGIDHVVSFTATDDSKILLRHYRINLKKSGSHLPLVDVGLVSSAQSLAFYFGSRSFCFTAGRDWAVGAADHSSHQARSCRAREAGPQGPARPQAQEEEERVVHRDGR